MTALPKIKMKVPQFLEWGDGRAGKFELVSGEVVMMLAEQVRHNLVRKAAVQALDDAVAQAKLPCTVYTDGMTVVIDENTARVPDAAVQCAEQGQDSLILDAPIIVVEVLSPSSEREDVGAKLAEYFSVASIQHYLIIDPNKPVVIHHARAQDGAIETRILTSGDVNLSPPGMKVPVARLLARA
jgi:Uma2 family endonuclease